MQLLQPVTNSKTVLTNKIKHAELFIYSSQTSLPQQIQQMRFLEKES